MEGIQALIWTQWIALSLHQPFKLIPFTVSKRKRPSLIFRWGMTFQDNSLRIFGISGFLGTITTHFWGSRWGITAQRNGEREGVEEREWKCVAECTLMLQDITVHRWVRERRKDGRSGGSVWLSHNSKIKGNFHPSLSGSFLPSRLPSLLLS